MKVTPTHIITAENQRGKKLTAKHTKSLQRKNRLLSNNGSQKSGVKTSA